LFIRVIPEGKHDLRRENLGQKGEDAIDESTVIEIVFQKPATTSLTP